MVGWGVVFIFLRVVFIVFCLVLVVFVIGFVIKGWVYNKFGIDIIVEVMCILVYVEYELGFWVYDVCYIE